jgi:hypothetical protein
MTDQERTTNEEELEGVEGQLLPDREVMSIVTPVPQPLPAAESGDVPEQAEPLRGDETP